MRLAIFALLATLVSAPVTAATVDQIVALSRAGVSEPVILALIDRDKTIFTLEPDQLVALKDQGVSERVVLAMLKSGRPEAEAAARAESALQQAHIAATSSTAPEVVVVGHGPDVPNADATTAAPPPVAVVAPYPVPYPIMAGPYAPFPTARGPHPRRDARPPHADRELVCMAPPGTDASVTARGVGLMPVCPPR